MDHVCIDDVLSAKGQDEESQVSDSDQGSKAQAQWQCAFDMQTSLL